MLAAPLISPTTTVPYHQQDSMNWCGSACVLMVLHSLGVVRSGGFPLDQKRVRMVAQNSARSDPTYQWASPPDGLAAALNYFCERSEVNLHYKVGVTPKEQGRRWELVVADSEEEISRYIVWTLWHYRTAAIALVFGMQHWVVVGGCVTSRPPMSPDDDGYEILGFHLCDPWPPIPRELARNEGFRHLDHRDPTGNFVVIDGCGSGWEGDPKSDARGGRGVALRYVSYSDWRMRDLSTPDRKRHTGYMTGVPPTIRLTTKPGKPEVPVRSRWTGKFLAICDPVATATEALEVGETTCQLERLLGGLRVARYRGVDAPQRLERAGGVLLRQLSTLEAIELARDALKTRYPLTKCDVEAETLVGTNKPKATWSGGLTALDSDEQGEPGHTVLVEWLDEPGTYHLEAAYYIVPFDWEGFQQVVVRIAARTPFRLEGREEEEGEKQRLFLGVNVLPLPATRCDGARQALAIMSEERARSMIAGHCFRSALGGRISVPEDYCMEGRVVWKPCIESFDPFCPFYEFEVSPQGDSSQPAYLYVRASDGKVFTHLTEHYGGA